MWMKQFRDDKSVHHNQESQSSYKIIILQDGRGRNWGKYLVEIKFPTSVKYIHESTYIVSVVFPQFSNSLSNGTQM